MSDGQVPDDVREFIQRHVDSIGQLEALLLLRANRTERWDAAAISKRLYISETDTRQILKRLCDDGLVACDDRAFWLADLPAERLGLLERLAETYARQLISITNLVHSKTRRIREFANAFRMRKDK